MSAASPRVDITISITHALYSQNQLLLTRQVQQGEVGAERSDVFHFKAWKKILTCDFWSV